MQRGNPRRASQGRGLRRAAESRGSPPNLPPSQAYGRKCNALLEDGSECHRFNPQYELCWQHQREHKRLYQDYKRLEKEYEALVPQTDGFSAADMGRKITLGKEVLDLRDEVNRRFFSAEVGRDNRGHIRWILKIRNEIKQLEVQAATANTNLPDKLHQLRTEIEMSSPSAEEEQPPRRPRMVYPSLLDLSVPIEALRYLPPDSPVRILRQALTDVRRYLIQKLYELAPPSNDSASTSGLKFGR